MTTLWLHDKTSFSTFEMEKEVFVIGWIKMIQQGFAA